MITMVIGGIWHGAGWTFLLWGAFHGVALTMNHLWRFAVRRLGRQNARPRLIFQALAFCLTFTTVVTGWVLFRAETIDGVATAWGADAGATSRAVGVRTARGATLRVRAGGAVVSNADLHGTFALVPEGASADLDAERRAFLAQIVAPRELRAGAETVVYVAPWETRSWRLENRNVLLRERGRRSLARATTYYPEDEDRPMAVWEHLDAASLLASARGGSAAVPPPRPEWHHRTAVASR